MSAGLVRAPDSRVGCTRRQLLGGGGRLAATVTALGAACASAPPADAAAPHRRFPSDQSLLAGLLAIEQAAAYAYERALGAGQLDATAQKLVGRVLACERAHALALGGHLRQLGAALPAAPADAVAAEGVLARGHVRAAFARRRDARGWLGLLVDIEDLLERNYHTALIELRSSELAELCAQIYANEAQHSALLALLLHPDDPSAVVGQAFVNGT
jgi:hypothetical protein